MCCRTLTTTTKEKEDQRDRNRYAKRDRVNVNRFLDVYPELMPEEGCIAHGFSVRPGRGVKGLASGRVVRVDEAFRS